MYIVTAKYKGRKTIVKSFTTNSQLNTYIDSLCRCELQTKISIKKQDEYKNTLFNSNANYSDLPLFNIYDKDNNNLNQNK
jgi:hypothetical protein